MDVPVAFVTEPAPEMSWKVTFGEAKPGDTEAVIVVAPLLEIVWEPALKFTLTTPTVTEQVPVLVGSATLFAVIVTGPLLAGGVKSVVVPLVGNTEPPDTVQSTSWFAVFGVTVAVSDTVPFERTCDEDGVAATLIAVTVTVQLFAALALAALVAVMVNVPAPGGVNVVVAPVACESVPPALLPIDQLMPVVAVLMTLALSVTVPFVKMLAVSCERMTVISPVTLISAVTLLFGSDTLVAMT